MSFQSFFAGLEAEFEHLLGIAVAAAPLVAVNDPNAAASIVAANAAVTYAKPLVDGLVAAAPVGTAISAAQIQAGLETGLALGTQSGAITAEKSAQINSTLAAISAIAAAAAKPVAP
jgi:hypothetical protein